MDSIKQTEKAEQAIRDNMLGYLERTVLPEVFFQFKEALLNQDNKLSKA